MIFFSIPNPKPQFFKPVKSLIMRAIIFVVLISLFTIPTQAQKTVEKTISIQPGDEVSFNFKRADVKFTSWNKNEISITGTAVIHMGENNDAFTVEAKQVDGDWNISTFLKDEKNLPKMIVMSKDGVKTYKKVDEKDNWKGWDNVVKGEKYDYVNYGIIAEINLEIKVPQNISMNIKSKFGDIDIVNFEGKLEARNTHGYIDASFSKPPKNDIYIKSTHDFVDVSIPSNAAMDVMLKSSHGNMLTNVDLNVETEKKGKKSRHPQKVNAKLNGGGKNLVLISTHDNVYLREYKMNN